MKKIIITLILLAGFIVSANCQTKNANIANEAGNQLSYQLPMPQTKGNISVEEALQSRRSRRQFIDKEISAEQLSQVLWSAYGITKPMNNPPFLRGGMRTAPSAGALFPLEIYVLVGKVIGIEPGFYRYISQENKIVRLIDKDLRAELCTAAYNQKMVKDAPAVLFYSAIYSRCTQKYGDRGRERYVCMDLGHSAENVYLQVEALNLGTCAIGAFVDKAIADLLKLDKEEEPLYIMPFGYCK